MAGGKLSPRQKMINMMYLVLTAMLALNVSKDILKALSKLDDSMHATVTTVMDGNNTLYAALAASAAEKERAKPWNAKAQELRPKADDAYQFIEQIKEHLITETGGRNPETNDLNGSDNRDVPQNYLVNEKSVGGGGKGKELQAQLEAYKAYLLQNAEGNAALTASINSTFNFEDQKIDGANTPWVEATFAELPLAGIIPFLTDLQSAVRRTESNMLEHFYSNVDASTIKFTGVRAVVQPKSTYVTTGSNYEADIFLAAFDESQDPDFTLNGEALSADQVSGGVAHVVLPGTGVGNKTFEGLIKLPGSEGEPVPFTLEYTVAPSSVVVSPTAMNVLYRQVKNPIAVSVPGVEPEDLVVSGNGIRQTGSGTYEADVTRVSGTEMNITVGVREEDGTVRNAGSAKFRIKGLPPAQTTILNSTGSGPYSAAAITSRPVGAEYDNFPFDLPLSVKSFQVVVPGEAPFNITGDRFTAAAKAAVEASRPGSTIIIRNVVATTPTGARVTDISAIAVDKQ